MITRRCVAVAGDEVGVPFGGGVTQRFGCGADAVLVSRRQVDIESGCAVVCEWYRRDGTVGVGSVGVTHLDPEALGTDGEVVPGTDRCGEVFFETFIALRSDVCVAGLGSAVTTEVGRVVIFVSVHAVIDRFESGFICLVVAYDMLHGAVVIPGGQDPETIGSIAGGNCSIDLTHVAVEAWDDEPCFVCGTKVKEFPLSEDSIGIGVLTDAVVAVGLVVFEGVGIDHLQLDGTVVGVGDLEAGPTVAGNGDTKILTGDMGVEGKIFLSTGKAE